MKKIWILLLIILTLGGVYFYLVNQDRQVKLYFYDEAGDKDVDGNIKCSADGLVPILREITFVDKNNRIGETIKILLSEILPGVTLTSVNLNDGTLTLTFRDPNFETSGGSCKVSILRAQIEATAKQFPGVEQVLFMPEDLFQP